MSRIDMTGGRASHSGGRGVTAEEMRRHNLAVVLEQLHLEGPISRSELTVMTGLNRSTVADLIAELVALGLVEEGPGLVTPGPGRPSSVVQPRPEGAVALAVELSVDSIAVATVGLGSHVYSRLRVARPRGRFSPQETVYDVAKLAGPLLGSLPKHVFAGVGVGVVGITRRSDGFVHLAPNLGWHNVPLAEILGEELGYDGLVLVANDADLGAIAEHRRGVRPGVQNLIYISGEVGIGTGIIVDGEPVLGSAGYAGEAGHMLVNPNGRRCRCGSVGCWETEAGEVALLRHAGTPDSGAGLEGVKAIADRAAAGDAKTLQALSEVGHWLGTGIGNLVNIFNPEMVVLGGMYHRLFPFLEEAINEAISTRALDAPAKMVTVTRSGLNSDAALIGASELVFSRVVADPARVTRAGLEA